MPKTNVHTAKFQAWLKNVVYFYPQNNYIQKKKDLMCIVGNWNFMNNLVHIEKLVNKKKLHPSSPLISGMISYVIGKEDVYENIRIN